MENSIIDGIASSKKALKVQDLANALNVAPRTIYLWVNGTGEKLPCIRVGSTIRFDPKTTADWLRERVFSLAT